MKLFVTCPGWLVRVVSLQPPLMCAQARFGISDGCCGRQVLGCVCSCMLELRDCKQRDPRSTAMPAAWKCTIRVCEERQYFGIEESWLMIEGTGLQEGL